MKKEDLFEAIGEIDGKSVQSAENYRAVGKPAWIRWAAIAACVALLVGIFAAVPLLKKGGNNLGENGAGENEALEHGAAENETGKNDVPEHDVGENETGGYAPGLVAVLANYPAPVAKKMSAEDFRFDGAYYSWLADYLEKAKASSGLQSGMDGYYAAIMEQLLPSEDENTVCSPLNTYIAFAMLAEVTGGNTRQQILDMLGATDVETLRKNITALWEGNYADTPMLTSILANSLWLRNDCGYNDDTLNTLAGHYYASSFHGEPGSKEMDEALQTWTDENTGGLLSDYAKNMHLDPDTVLALVSTIYFKAGWENRFWSAGQATFHGVKGDTQTDMMDQTETLDYFRGDEFAAVSLPLSDSGSMYFFLPDEGVDVNALTADPEVFRTLRNEGGGRSRTDVHVTAPEFRISAKTDLLETLRTLGVTDALNPDASDFTPLTEEINQIFVGAAEHAAMVEIDQEGVTGAAYTVGLEEAASEPEEPIDFVLDRPFMFVITGADGSILFSGVVRNVE